jgi:hypothetical protein
MVCDSNPGEDPAACLGSSNWWPRHASTSYGNSKLAQIWHVAQLNRLGAVTAVCACPLLAATGISGSEGRDVLAKFAQGEGHVKSGKYRELKKRATAGRLLCNSTMKSALVLPVDATKVERKAPLYSSYSMFTFKNLNPCILDTCRLHRMRLFL